MRDRNQLPRWPAQAAAAWTWIFAAMSFYWAAGGTIGISTIGGPTQRQDSGTIALLVVTGLLKVIAGVFALALVSPWGRRAPRRLMRTLAWVGGFGLLLYSIALLIQHGLMAAGVIERAASLTASELRWHLWFWDPFWLLGGILFAAAAWAYAVSDTRR